MDANGYNESLFNTVQDVCFWCHSQTETIRHEVYYGSDKQSAKALGLWVNICPICHRLVHDLGEDKKPSKTWRELGRQLLIDALAKEIGENTATQMVDDYVTGNIKHWELKEMEGLYGREHRKPRLD